jgi:hypothetical protein
LEEEHAHGHGMGERGFLKSPTRIVGGARDVPKKNMEDGWVALALSVLALALVAVVVCAVRYILRVDVSPLIFPTPRRPLLDLAPARTTSTAAPPPPAPPPTEWSTDETLRWLAESRVRDARADDAA